MPTLTIKSHTNPDQSYLVTLPLQPDQLPSCTCKGYGYRRTCSHIKEAIVQLDEQLQQVIASADAREEYFGVQPVCRSCGAPLTGTHHKLDKCPACYRRATFAKSK